MLQSMELQRVRDDLVTDDNKNGVVEGWELGNQKAGVEGRNFVCKLVAFEFSVQPLSCV